MWEQEEKNIYTNKKQANPRTCQHRKSKDKIRETPVPVHGVEIPAAIYASQRRQQRTARERTRISQPSHIQQLLSVYTAIIPISFVTLKRRGKKKKQQQTGCSVQTSFPHEPSHQDLKLSWLQNPISEQFQYVVLLHNQCSIIKRKLEFIFFLNQDFFFFFTLLGEF